MKTYSKLQEIVDHLRKKHKLISASSEGVYGMKFLKRIDGSRQIIEIIDGFRVFNYEIYNENNLILTQYANGYSFKNNTKVSMNSRLFLEGLIMINAYEHSAEFFTAKSIDFSYAEKSLVAQATFMDEMFNKKNNYGKIKAQWINFSEDVEEMLNEICSGRKRIKKSSVGIGVAIEKDDIWRY